MTKNNISHPLNHYKPAEYSDIPEKKLWIAIIERALLDLYALHQQRLSLLWTNAFKKKQKKSLSKFFFEKEAKPNNFKYICKVIDLELGYVEKIIKYVKQFDCLDENPPTQLEFIIPPPKKPRNRVIPKISLKKRCTYCHEVKHINAFKYKSQQMRHSRTFNQCIDCMTSRKLVG